MMLALYAGPPTWEVIGDTTIGSPVASVEHTIDIDLYSIVWTRAINLTATIADNMWFGFQLQQTDDTVDVDASGVIDAVANFTIGGDVIMELQMQSLFDKSAAIHRTWWTGVRTYITSGGIAHGEAEPEGDASASTKIVYFYSADGSDFTVATATNMSGGRIITYGLRRPT